MTETADRPLRAIVIGGGAAGFFGAIAAAQAHPNLGVTLLEAGRQPLTKVRISGGGRCNVTHHCFDPAQLINSYPRGGKALRGAFSRFQPRDTIAWFAARGVPLKTEADGRMFPTTDDSATIAECLLAAACKAGVELQIGSKVQAISCQDEQFSATLKSGEELRCDRLLLATGSNPHGYRLARNLGHTIREPVPSLFTFNLSDRRLHDLAGISVEPARVRLLAGKRKLEQTGPLLVTHWGLSGPVVLKLSAWGARWLHEANYQLPLEINWLPDYNLETLRDRLQAIKAEMPRRQVSRSCPFPLPRRLWQRLVAIAEIPESQRWAELSKKTLSTLAGELTGGCYRVQGKGVFKDEFVTCGGVELKEVDFRTMESRRVRGLYFAGEILDIDGITGGFNFQSAWTTSWLAGQNMGNGD